MRRLPRWAGARPAHSRDEGYRLWNRDRGKQLRAGQFVITGSLVTSKFPRKGDAVGFDLGELGRIELKVN